ncbi:MAG: hypothetical protein IAG13_26905, partial [Deltaproteobacteria bacterium]|nr:hypothetical protein [Nannocystaceae bacterium]
KTPAAKKPSAKKPAAKKPAAKTPAAKKPTAAPSAPASSRKAVAKRTRRGPSTEELGAHEVLARLSMFARAQEDVGEELTALVARLEQLAEAALVPALFGVLDDDDPHGVLWSVFYLLESFDDAYFDGLLTVLPDLYERAPGWAETAILRIANTRGEPEDCIDAVVVLAKQRKAPVRRKLVALVDRIAADTEGLHPSQRRSVEQLARAIEA